MKLFPYTGAAIVIGSLLLITTSQSAFADGRGHDRHGWTPASSHRQGWGHDRGRSRQHDFGIRHDNRYRPVSHHDYRSRSHDSWSISLNLGSGYSRSNFRYGTGLYAGTGYGFYNTYYDNPRYAYAPYRSRTVVVNRPTVVYVNDSAPVSGHVTQRPARSLLRDIHGNCFERYYDSRGNETRVSVPASECRF